MSDKLDAFTIIKKLKDEIANAELDLGNQAVGTVISVADGVVSIAGLSEVANGEVVVFEDGSEGLVMNLESDLIGAIVLSKGYDIREGQSVKSSGTVLSVPVSEELIGRVIDPLGNPLDGKGELKIKERNLVERSAPGVLDRQSVRQPLQTGIKAIDAMIPIGKGQRELIIGDRQTGKTTIAIDTIINQKGKNVICIYVAIAQKQSKIAQIVKELEDHGALDHTIIVTTSASDPSAMSYIAPFSGCAIGEYFMDLGQDALVVYDDLSKHAVAYREISLLLRRPSGREAYPGDVFYLHSRLLERSAKLSDNNKAGSLTALPIIETQAGDVSAYIPTNVISITDGQIYLESDLFYQGIRPAINVGLSVSRVGSAAQTKSIKKVASKLRLDLAQFRDLAAFAQFASDLDISTKTKLELGTRLVEILKQPQYQPNSNEQQVALIFAATNNLLQEISVEDIARWSEEYWDFLQTQKVDLLKKMIDTQDLDEVLQSDLKNSIEEFNKVFK